MKKQEREHAGGHLRGLGSAFTAALGKNKIVYLYSADFGEVFQLYKTTFTEKMNQEIVLSNISPELWVSGEPVLSLIAKPILGLNGDQIIVDLYIITENNFEKIIPENRIGIGSLFFNKKIGEEHIQNIKARYGM